MEQKRILCVDDDADMRRAIVDTLTQSGFSVAEESAGEEAVERLLRESFDLVLLDIAMPGMSGIDVLRVLGRQQRKCPVIVLTGKAGFQMATESLMLGAVEFVTKLFAPEFLLDTVNRILGNDEEHTPPQKPNAS